jgi:hypothetical protein
MLDIRWSLYNALLFRSLRLSELLEGLLLMGKAATIRPIPFLFKLFRHYFKLIIYFNSITFSLY